MVESIVRSPVFCRIDPGSRRVPVKPSCSLATCDCRNCALDDESEVIRLNKREVRLMAGRGAPQYPS